ncbi:hypothetical protein Scep_014699 [Stephania cephalantha]|uniref:Uncharacterized protein n=1 Tax=Stephania cephalantha TaxID=152367 RepID=A0AAP0J3N6_9MAGN
MVKQLLCSKTRVGSNLLRIANPIVFDSSFRPTSIINQKLNMATSPPQFFAFGPYKISEKEVFYTTGLSYAMVNLRPLVPGRACLPKARSEALC